MTVGERIRLIRESKGIKQNALAKMINITPSYLSLIEKGAKTPDIDMLSDFSKALDVSFQEIVCDYLVSSDNSSTSEQIKIAVEKFTPEHQKFILETLTSVLSRMNKL